MLHPKTVKLHKDILNLSFFFATDLLPCIRIMQTYTSIPMIGIYIFREYNVVRGSYVAGQCKISHTTSEHNGPCKVRVDTTRNVSCDPESNL